MAPKPAPDFRKIKAKVGKRAPKPANLTDTSFKAASLSLREQIVQVTKQAEGATSSRGRSILELSTQLQHPARAVRISAAKGLYDIITHTQQPQDLRQSISTWVQVSSKCCVDEEDEVRTMGLQLLKHFLLALKSESETLTPFAGLLMAFLSSALNSLDKATRRDGAEAVAMLSRYAPNVVRPYVTRKLLPTFVRLLTDYRIPRSSQAGNQQGSEKSSKRGTKRKLTSSKPTNGPQSSILEAFVLVLESANNSNDRTIDSYESLCSNSQLSHGGVTFGSQSRNALQLRNSCIRRKRNYGASFEQLVNDSAAATINVGESPSKKFTDNVLFQTVKDLLSKLRDRFLEVTQKGFQYDGDTFRMSWEDLVVAHQIVKCIRLVWRTYGRAIASHIHHFEPADKFKKQCDHLVDLMLERFPFYEDGSPTSRAGDANTEVCFTVLFMRDLSNFGLVEKRKHQVWVQKVAVYVQNHLESCSNPDSSNDRIENAVAFSTLSTSILLVLYQLLLYGDKWEREGNKATSSHMAGLFSSLFFGDGKRKTYQMNRSKVARSAVRVLIALLQHCDYRMDQLEQQFGSQTSKAVEMLPTFLVHWQQDFEGDSSYVIMACLKLVRQIRHKNDPIRSSLRLALDPILAVREYDAESSHVFEKISPQLQRDFVSLVILLGPPTEKALKGLGKLCMRSNLSRLDETICPAMAGYIVWSIHAIRKEVRMQSYLGFLVEATGILELETWSGWEETEPGIIVASPRLYVLDSAISDLLGCLIQCGPKKVLPSLHPLFLRLMKTNPTSFLDLIGVRASLSLLAGFSVDIQREGPSLVVGDLLPPELVEVTQATISRFFHGSRSLGLLSVKNWTRPFFALLSTERDMFRDFFSHQLGNLATYDSSEQANLFECINAALEHPLLNRAAHEEATDLITWAENVHTSQSDSKLKESCGRLLDHLKLFSLYHADAV